MWGGGRVEIYVIEEPRKYWRISAAYAHCLVSAALKFWINMKATARGEEAGGRVCTVSVPRSCLSQKALNFGAKFGAFWAMALKFGARWGLWSRIRRYWQGSLFWKQLPWWWQTDTQEHSTARGSGKKFERKKVRIGEKVELFSSWTFFLHGQHLPSESTSVWITILSQVRPPDGRRPSLGHDPRAVVVISAFNQIM